jgi:hypothetical protein
MIAEIFYRVLGMAAWANERMSHYSANFIPANWAVFTALGVFLMIGFPELWDAWLNGTPTSLGNPWELAAIEFVLLIGLGLFLVTFGIRYVVFRKTAPDILSTRAATPAWSTPDVPLPEENLEKTGGLRATGKFVLDAQTAQRFLNVPASVKIVETGDIALLSKINASITMYETMVLKERIGVWYLLMKRDRLRSLEPGRLYLGTAARPALRVGYMDAITSRPATVILSFADETQRQSFVAFLAQRFLKEV